MRRDDYDDRDDYYERKRSKIPITEREFLWVQDDDKGLVILHAGPTVVSPNATESVVISDGRGGFLKVDDDPHPARRVELSDEQYAVLYNPLADRLPEEEVNGKVHPGRNEGRRYLNGTRHMVPGPASFCLWPGQEVEIRDAHELDSNQYLLVKVYGEVDRSSPYYSLTARSAAITSATLEPLADSAEELTLSRGQLIVIRGLDTSLYIPPTGVDVVPDLSLDESGEEADAHLARELLEAGQGHLELDDGEDEVIELYESADGEQLLDDAVSRDVEIRLGADLNLLAKRAEDPQNVLSGYMDDLADEEKKLQKKLASTLRHEKRLAQHMSDGRRKASELESQVEAARRAGRGRLAAEARKRIAEQERLEAEYAELARQAAEEKRKLAEQTEALKRKMEEAQRKKELLSTRNRKVKSKKKSKQVMTGKAEAAAFDRLETKIAAEEKKEARDKGGAEGLGGLYGVGSGGGGGDWADLEQGEAAWEDEDDDWAEIEEEASENRPLELEKSEEPEPEPEPELSDEDVDVMLSSSLHRRALEREARKAMLVRSAVLLAEKEFCVIVDADGRRQILCGPARVFPGPYDSFLTRGSDDRIYKAYALLPTRGLWLRFVQTIGREALAKLLPRGVALEQDVYQPGDELIVSGVNAFFFPFEAIEVLDPVTGLPHLGNDHERVFIEAIGIDPKSGIYVRELATGEVRLVRGPRSYLIDPRAEVRISRKLSAREWNLWIAPNSGRRPTRLPVVTEWAISLEIPRNFAVMIDSTQGSRMVEGPGVEVLAYGERLTPLRLSTSTPKDEGRRLVTCYLKVRHNRVSDRVILETADFVRIDAHLRYHISFEDAHRDRWFRHENYVGVITNHLRSVLRADAKLQPLSTLWPNLPRLLRERVLGHEGAGRFFEETGMRVHHLEVLGLDIRDPGVQSQLSQAQREEVMLLLSDARETQRVVSEQLRHTLKRERLELALEARKIRDVLRRYIRAVEHEDAMTRQRLGAELDALEAKLSSGRQRTHTESELALRAEREEARRRQTRIEAQRRVQAEQARHTEAAAHQRALQQIAERLLATKSNATVAERDAVQAGLVEAISTLGDKMALTDVAQNMNLISLFRGQDVQALFTQLLGEVRTANALKTDSQD